MAWLPARYRERFQRHRRLILAIALAELLALILAGTIDRHNYIDAEIYQLGTREWLNGGDMYGQLPRAESGLRLPFIYPPFAAIVFTPLALLPKWPAAVLITIISHVALLITLYVLFSAAEFLRAHRDKTLLIAAVVLPLATLTDPVLETLQYGQINIVLMALVVVDCLWRTGHSQSPEPERKLPYPRGMLIGIAAGLKLTPAIFVLFFLMRKDFRSTVTAAVTFAATAVLGVLLAFGNAVRFWSEEILSNGSVSFGPDFTGDASIFAGNQSLRSLLTKLELPHGATTAVYGVLALAVLVLAVSSLKALLDKGDLPMAVTVVGIAQLLISPISWSHHWVWAISGLLLLIGQAYAKRDWGMVLVVTMVSTIFVIGPHWDMPQGDGKELRWSMMEHSVGNSYVYLGFALLLYFGLPRIMAVVRSAGLGSKRSGASVAHNERKSSVEVSARENDVKPVPAMVSSVRSERSGNS